MKLRTYLKTHAQISQTNPKPYHITDLKGLLLECDPAGILFFVPHSNSTSGSNDATE